MEKVQSLFRQIFTPDGIKQFIKFGLVGVSNTIVSFAVYYCLYFIGVYYLIANLTGFFVSVLNSYYWNNKYVFQKKKNGNIKALLKTYMSYGSTFLLSTALLYFFVEFLNISPGIAPIISTLIVIPINFLLNKLWAFK